VVREVLQILRRRSERTLKLGWIPELFMPTDSLVEVRRAASRSTSRTPFGRAQTAHASASNPELYESFVISRAHPHEVAEPGRGKLPGSPSSAPAMPIPSRSPPTSLANEGRTFKSCDHPIARPSQIPQQGATRWVECPGWTLRSPGSAGSLVEQPTAGGRSRSTRPGVIRLS